MKKYITLICAAFLLLVYSCSEDTIDVVLLGSISGTVKAKDGGEAIEGVKITTNPASTTVFTDSEGKFILPKVPVDDYSVQATKDGFVTGFEPVTVIENTNSEVAFELSISKTNNLPPTAPILVSPEDGAVEQPLNITFVWTASDPEGDDLKYTLDLRNGNTDEMQMFEISQDTTFTVSNLNLSTKYFWQVTADDSTNEPVSSAISEFTTLTLPDNPYLFVKPMNGNLVIFSGDSDPVTGTDHQADFNVLQLTNENVNSFRPRQNLVAKKIAFLRNSGGNTQIYTMNFDGTSVSQITSQKPVAGFRTEELDFTWAKNGSKLYYPYFDKLYSINPDGSGRTLLYSTPDGSFISEIDVPEFDDDLVLLKTNNSNGYDVRIFTVRLSTQTEETVILENVQGAAGGVNISANASQVLYNYDVSGSENSSYRIFKSRIFLYNISMGAPAQELDTNVIEGENDLDVKFSPTEGGVIYTRVGNNLGATPNIYSTRFDQLIDDVLLFTNAFMPDWE